MKRIVFHCAECAQLLTLTCFEDAQVPAEPQCPQCGYGMAPMPPAPHVGDVLRMGCLSLPQPPRNVPTLTP